MGTNCVIDGSDREFSFVDGFSDYISDVSSLETSTW